MSNISFEKAVEIGVQAGVKEALERIEKANKERVKFRHDRRLRNTKLLLRNYNKFKLHCKNAVYTSKKLENLNAIDVLDEVDCIDDESLYVNSIKKNHDKTYIIVNHINRMLMLYKHSIEKSGDENAIRGYAAMELFYMSKEKMTYDEIAKKLNVSERTIFRDLKKTIEDLSALIFGVDGVRLEI